LADSKTFNSGTRAQQFSNTCTTFIWTIGNNDNLDNSKFVNAVDCRARDAGSDGMPNEIAYSIAMNTVSPDVRAGGGNDFIPVINGFSIRTNPDIFTLHIFFYNWLK
jgi:hypothetical protein